MDEINLNENNLNEINLNELSFQKFYVIVIYGNTIKKIQYE